MPKREELEANRYLRPTERGRVLIGDEMGLGKTIQTLALMLGRPEEAHLVICPTSVSPLTRSRNRSSKVPRRSPSSVTRVAPSASFR